MMIPPLQKKTYSFQKNILESIKRHQLLEKGDGVVVGVSGGADSTALLLALSSLPLELRLVPVYVDHGLRPEESPKEIKQVTALCMALNANCVIETVDVTAYAKIEGRSTEDAARLLRYQALEKIRGQQNCAKIAVGHHGDDQVEEFFVRLIRGTGATGLSGMRACYKNVIRPLLFESKKNIEEYLLERETSWSTDSSNLSDQFLRNRIRLNLIPDLEQNYNPNIRNTVLNTMDILQQEDDLLASITTQQYESCVLKERQDNKEGTTTIISLNIDSFLANHRAIQRRIVDSICWQMDSRPSFSTHNDLHLFARTAVNGKELHLSNGLRVVKTDTALIFKTPTLAAGNRGSEKVDTPFTIIVDKPDIYQIPGTSITITLSCGKPTTENLNRGSVLQIDMDLVTFPMVIRGVRAGERFAPSTGITKKISRYYNEIKLDKRNRTSWPLLVCQESVVAIIGKSIDHRYRVSPETTNVLSISM